MSFIKEAVNVPDDSEEEDVPLSPELLPLLLYVSMLLAVNSVWRCQAKL